MHGNDRSQKNSKKEKKNLFYPGKWDTVPSRNPNLNEYPRHTGPRNREVGWLFLVHYLASPRSQNKARLVEAEKLAGFVFPNNNLKKTKQNTYNIYGQGSFKLQRRRTKKNNMFCFTLNIHIFYEIKRKKASG